MLEEKCLKSSSKFLFNYGEIIEDDRYTVSNMEVRRTKFKIRFCNPQEKPSYFVVTMVNGNTVDIVETGAV